MHDHDTIAAISTPPGDGGIGIVRLSGPGAIPIALKLFSPKGKKNEKNLADLKSHRMLYGFITGPETGEQVDEVLISVMRAPNTYTREDMVEINCHGGSQPIARTMELLLKGGARLALPGEFTKRAFLNGRIALTQAEAVLALIKAKSDEAGRNALAQLKGGLGGRVKQETGRLARLLAHLEASIDFPEEEIEPDEIKEIAAGIEEMAKRLNSLSNSYEEGKLLRDGIKTAILGKPNVGKSSLLNALLGEDRAIVTDMPGTTRDVIAEYINLGGYALKIMDTAGIRRAADKTEAEGVKKSLSALEEADLVLCVLDGSARLEEEDLCILDRITERNKRSILIINKKDLPLFPFADGRTEMKMKIHLSAKTGEGIEELKEAIIKSFRQKGQKDAGAETGVLITSLRHKTALDTAARALGGALEAVRAGLPAEIVSLELSEALRELGGITGEVSTDDILAIIFNEFCIGK